MIGDKAKKALVREEICNATSFLRGWLTSHPQNMVEELAEVVKTGPGWIAEYHFGWGMSIRNILRTNGYGEKVLGVKNLDDIYVPMIEFVVMTIFISDIFFHDLLETLLVNTISRSVADSERFYKLQDLGEINYPRFKDNTLA